MIERVVLVDSLSDVEGRRRVVEVPKFVDVWVEEPPMPCSASLYFPDRYQRTGVSLCYLTPDGVGSYPVFARRP